MYDWLYFYNQFIAPLPETTVGVSVVVYCGGDVVGPTKRHTHRHDEVAMRVEDTP